jgi:hypothetical protein
VFRREGAHAPLIRQRHEECEAVALKLLEFDPTSYQASQVERANVRSACRHLTIMLVQQCVDEGRYPSSLSIADSASWGSQESEFILRGLSSIEDYETFENSFSFTGVSSKGHHCVRVVDGQVMD